MKITIVVVLYNTLAEESQTLQTLSEDLDENYTLVIWDNSTQQLQHNFDFLKDTNLIYKKSRENKSLGQIYSIIFRMSHDEYILLMDQDSLLEKAFLIKARQYISQYPEANLLLPNVFFKNTIINTIHR